MQKNNNPSPYRSLSTGKIEAPKKVKGDPRATKTTASGDLRNAKRR